MSGGAGLVFRGSGFYITDYGKDGKKDQRTAGTPDAGSETAKPAAAPGTGDGAAATGSTSGAAPAPAPSPAAASSEAPKPARDTGKSRTKKAE